MTASSPFRSAIAGLCAVALSACALETDGTETSAELEAEEIEQVSEALVQTVTGPVDTHVRAAAPYGNFGDMATMVVSANPTAASSQNSLVRFPQSAVATAVGNQAVYSARLELTPQAIDAGWGGGRIAAHRMLRGWEEGTGVGGFFGRGYGATWTCANDTDTALLNNANNCAAGDLWRVGATGSGSVPYAAAPTGTARLYSVHGTAPISIDVTADVKAFLSGTGNFGWMLRGMAEPRSGNTVTFSTRESNAAPRLVIDVGPDLCPADAAKTKPGICGCGQPETDSDGDGTPNCAEPSLVPEADTTVQLVSPYGNFGQHKVLSITSASVAGLERALLRFNQQQIATAVSAAGGSLFSAEIELTVLEMDPNWQLGRVELRPLTQTWVEGNGVDTVLGAYGASWDCANDTATTGVGTFFNDCTTANRWAMGPSALPPPFGAVTASAQLNGDKTKVVRFDVTEDVKRFLAGQPNHGWVIKGSDGIFDGTWVRFASRETLTPPRLILNASAACPATGPVLDERSYLRTLTCFDTTGEATRCNLRAQAKANSDRHMGAGMYVAKDYSPAETLVLTRDRTAKLRALYADPDRLAAFCAGDTDGDMVPDIHDACPNTRPLRPTDAQGCEDTALPLTPPREAIDAILDTMGVTVDPRCATAPRPDTPNLELRFTGVYRDFGKGGLYVITLPPVGTNQPTDCELEYQFQIDTIHADGDRKFTTLTFSSQNDPRVSRTTLRTLFTFHVNQGGDAALWKDDTVGAVMSVRIVNGKGEASGWSPAKYFDVTEW